MKTFAHTRLSPLKTPIPTGKESTSDSHLNPGSDVDVEVFTKDPLHPFLVIWC